MRKALLFVLLSVVATLTVNSQTIDPSQWPGMVGYWNFDDSLDLTHAVVGLDLELFGSDQAVPGPSPDDGATRVGVGDHYKCTHQIEPNGGGNFVNEYSLVVDFKIPQTGQYYCFYQTNMTNSNDGEVFINPGGHVGITETGYSYCVMIPGEWYRLVISVDLGNSFNYYIDGHLILEGVSQPIDGRYSLDPYFHWFWDDNGEDNEFDIAACAIFDYPVNADEVLELGGYGHTFPPPPVDWMNAYLQTVTDSSAYICWHSVNLSSTVVEYGTDTTLGQQTEGSYENISGKIWHTVHLTGLEPDIEYFYRCISGGDTSDISSFRTQKLQGTADAHVRFVLLGDTRSDPYTVHTISTVIEEQLTADYGTAWQNEVDFVINVGDIVESGGVINQYLNHYFLPYSNLTDKVPFYVSIGNHEAENPIYYKYMKYEELTGAPYQPPSTYNEKFYAFRYGDCQFVALNSNVPYRIPAQTQWFEHILDSCETDPGIDFVITFCHHPGHSEVWPDGNTDYIQNEIIPLLQNYSRPAMLFYGHTHAYEHGTVSLDAANPQHTNDMHIVLSGGGGAPLDRWGMYANQQDYDEIFLSLDQYDYSIVDVDVSDKSYTARTFSLGNPDKIRDNELVDQWYCKRDQPKPDKPSALDPVIVNDTVIFQGSEFGGVDSLMTSQIQISDMPGNYSTPVLDRITDEKDVYGDSGPPDYIPVDLHLGLDITMLKLPVDFFQTVNYGWRIRYRDHNLKWSEWSDENVFTVTQLNDHAAAGVSLQTKPNPFNGKTTIVVETPGNERISLIIYNDKNIETDIILKHKKLKSGTHVYTWSPGNLPAGVYICKLLTRTKTITSKMIYLNK